MSCPNCPKTERTLAKAITIIEQMLATSRALSIAQRNADEHTESLKRQRVEASLWLEGLL